MTQYRETNQDDWKQTMTWVAVTIGIVVGGAMLFMPTRWYLFIIITIVALWRLIDWHANNFAYRCPDDGEIIEISTWTDFISPQGITRQLKGWKYLKCPHCQRRVRAIEIRIE